MSQPIFAPLHQGDPHDDDAQVISDYVTEIDAPPVPTVDPIIVPEPPLLEPKPTTRLLTVSQLIRIAWTDSTQLLPRDNKRQDTQIWVYSTAVTPSATTDYVTITDEKNKTGGKLRHGQTLSLPQHTGELWVTASGSIADMNVEYWVTTT